jgi:hypothetical protein
MVLGGVVSVGSGTEAVDITGCTVLSKLKFESSGEDKPHAKPKRRSWRGQIDFLRVSIKVTHLVVKTKLTVKTITTITNKVRIACWSRLWLLVSMIPFQKRANRKKKRKKMSNLRTLGLSKRKTQKGRGQHKRRCDAMVAFSVTILHHRCILAISSKV